MTIVEFLDQEPLANVISMHSNHPDEVIFVGASAELQEQQESLQRLAAKISPQTKLSFVPVVKTKLSKIVKVLSGIAEQHPGCSFDLTGGDDLALVAMGIVFERYREKGIQLHQYNLRTNHVYDCDGDRDVVSGEIPPMSVADNIVLHGGCIVREDRRENGTYDWDFNEEFVGDIETMWRINCRDCGRWNAQISSLGDILSFSDGSDPLAVSVNIDAVRRSQERKDYRLDLKGVFSQLAEAGLLLDLVNDGTTFGFRFKNDQVRRTLEKAGTILELKTCLIARTIEDEDGPVFTDAMVGAFIDWDGVVHTRSEYLVDTENEIDVLLMNRLLPVFISCKNGSVGEDELYKLNTVAHRFGGKYVRKILVATTFGKGARSMDFFRERADDMNIEIVEGVHELTDSIFADALHDALKRADQR